MVDGIELQDRVIGHDEPTYVIAEAGINHNGSVQIAKRLVDIAVDAGADAVKFQKREMTETYVEEIVENPTLAEMGVEYTVSNLKDVLLTDTQYRDVSAYCEEQGIQFLCSPWDRTSVDYLEDLGVPFYKVGSPDMTNFVLLERLVETGEPLLVSTGMSEEKEIDRTVDFLEERNVEFGLLHCRSTYPAPFQNLNLDFIGELRRRYDVPVGYSGHERGIAISTAAVAMGACAIERHFTIARDMEGPDHSASLEASGLNKLVRDIRHLEESLGVPRRYISRGEYNNRVSLAKSLASTREIQRGEEISREDLTAKSPAKGISPQELYTVIGKQAHRDIEADEIITWDAVEQPEEEEAEIDLDNWGIVVRFSDVDEHDWGHPDVFEFRINGADLEEEFDLRTYDQALSIHAPEQKGHDIIDLSARDETVRREGVEIMQRVIDKVREKVKPAFPTTEPPIIIHPGGITEHDFSLDAIAQMNQALERSMGELDDEGVQLLLENMPPFPWIYGGQQHHNNFMDAGEIADFCERTGWTICYDTSHAKLWCNYAGVDLYEHAKTLKPYTEYLHVSDAIGVDGEGIQIEEGDIDWERLMSLYEDFDGPIITEIWRGHEKRGSGFKDAARRLAKYHS
jgi:N-acetylneuraminate synthase